jgi:DNA-binding transcriptional LysR family regulator
MSEMNIDDRLDFRLLRYFAVVAEELHFGRAAARLGIAQPPLSQHIKRLEQVVGMELFQRTSRRVTLTDAGATLLAATQRAAQEVARGLDAAEAVASGQAGRLSIGYAHLAMPLLLPSLIRAFRKQHPSVRLTLHGVPTSTQLELLRTAELDAAFATDVEPGAGLVIHRRWVEPLIHVRPRSGTVEAEGLVLFPRPQAPHLYDRIVAIANEMGISSTVGQEADSWYSVASLVAAGLGVTIAPQTIKRYRVPGLEYQSLGRRPPEVSVALVTRAERFSSALQAFVDQARR